ncbi:PTS sugar transporter subunit IIA [uncultured Veillonella sp.]|uniref:PTS sugar transporter subunit IIA n=1 Tax=uncultured Veillonella sp. TaxID=159268 RepID=UPI0025F3AE4C|nr:PTS sugar transporter subunit IIA [uncultured Veillonella sp.]MDY3974302.1 PTS sugar transporter subunit IIA [Veillonella caviae]
MSSKMYDKSCVFLNVEANSNEEAVRWLAEQLYEQGRVKEGYLTRIIEREAEYPTGLLCGAINVAVPHTEVELVNQKTLGIAVLKKPVQFHRMDAPEELVDVSVLFMFALTEAHAHVEMLQKVFEFIQGEGNLEALTKADTLEAALQVLDEKL